MNKSLLVGGLFVLSVAVAPMSVSADTTVTIENTGQRSVNKVKIGKKGRRVQRCRRVCGSGVMNNNNFNAAVNTDQDATSGNAKVKKNTKGGDAKTGDASNDNALIADVLVVNSNGSGDGCGCDGGDVNVVIDTTGQKSKNIVKVYGTNGGGKKRIKNNNNVNLDVNTDQDAKSGNATVSKNTGGGDATTGDASNYNDTNVNVDVNNDNGSGDGCGCGGGDIDVNIGTTGQNSKNKVYVGGGSGSGGTYVANNNNFNAALNTTQNATSGNAKVSKNTGGGNATTGNATNTNSSTVNVSFSNNN